MNSKERRDLQYWINQQKIAAERKSYKAYAEKVTGKPWHIIEESIKEGEPDGQRTEES